MSDAMPGASMKAIPATVTSTQEKAGAQAGVNVAELIKRARDNAGVSGVYVFLAVMTIFAVFPIYFVLYASLSPTQALISTELQLIPTHPSLSNYTYVFQQLPFLRWMYNSILVCALATIIALLCSTTGAYALSRFRFRGRQQALLMMIALQTFPGLLAIYAYYYILQTLHLSGTTIGLALVYAAGNIVFGVWNIKGYFDTLPIELEEAARVDGASYTVIFTRIILPLAMPALAASAPFMFIGGWNESAASRDSGRRDLTP